MNAAFLTLFYGIGLAAVAAGLIDATGKTLGGGGVQHWLAGAVVVLCFGIGAGRWSPSVISKAVGGRGSRVLFLLWLATGALVLPGAAAAVAGMTAGPSLSMATMLGIVWAVVVAGVPALALGQWTADRMDRAPAWNALILGIGLGWSAALVFGLGAIGFGIALAMVAIVVLATQQSENEEEAAATLYEALPIALLGATVLLVLVFLWPMLDAFDSSAAQWDGVRAGLMLLFAWIGAVTFGSALSDMKFARVAGALVSAGVAVGVVQAADRLAHYSNSSALAGFLSWTPLLQVNQWLGGTAGLSKLHEGEPFYTAAIVVSVSILVFLFLGCALRIAVRARGAQEKPLAAGRSLGALTVGVGLAWLIVTLGGSGMAGSRPLLAMGCALASAALLALRAPAPQANAPRLALALLLVGVPAALLPLPAVPPSAMPYFDIFRWKLVDEAPALRTTARVVERNASNAFGASFAGDGRNLFGAGQERRDAVRTTTLLAASLAESLERVLLVGSPLGESVQALDRVGAKAVHVACDPPELVDLALRARNSSGERVPTGWEGMSVEAVTATAAEADGPFDLVLLQEEALWDRKRNALSPEQIAIAFGAVKEDGTLAVAIDPERAPAWLAGSVAFALAKHRPEVELWLVPRAWRTPQLLVTAREHDRLAAPAPLIQIELGALGVYIANDADLRLLRVAENSEWPFLERRSLAGPLNPAASQLGAVEPRIVEELRESQRAAAILAAIEDGIDRNEASLLSFYRLHLEGQEYSIDDTLYVKEAKWLDVSGESIDRLLALTREHPQSQLLRRLWIKLAPLLVNKREVGIAQESYTALVEELGWNEAEFHTVLGSVSLEMLDPEAALGHADAALGLRPNQYNSLTLKAKALRELFRPSDAIDVYRQLFAAYPEPEAEHLRAYGELLLDTGDTGGAQKVGEQIQALFGDESLGRKLGELLGVEAEAMVHPERES